MKLFRMGKRGQIANAVSGLSPFVIAFGLAVVISSILALVVSSVDDTFTAGTAEANVSANGLSGIQNLSGQYATIGTVGGVLFLLIMVLGIFGVRRLGK